MQRVQFERRSLRDDDLLTTTDDTQLKQAFGRFDLILDTIAAAGRI